MEEKLSKAVLESLGFTHRGKDECEFVNINMPYWVKNSVCLFYNEQGGEPTHYLLGFGFMHKGQYFAADIRWLTSFQDVCGAYKALTGKEMGPSWLMFTGGNPAYANTETTPRKYKIALNSEGEYWAMKKTGNKYEVLSFYSTFGQARKACMEHHHQSLTK